MKQFEIYEADLSPVIGSEQGGIRPVIILQSVFNGMDRILCAPLTSKESNNDVCIKVTMQDKKIAHIMSDQLRGIDRGRLRKKIGELSEKDCGIVKDKLMKLIKPIEVYRRYEEIESELLNKIKEMVELKEDFCLYICDDEGNYADMLQFGIRKLFSGTWIIICNDDNLDCFEHPEVKIVNPSNIDGDKEEIKSFILSFGFANSDCNRYTFDDGNIV